MDMYAKLEYICINFEKIITDCVIIFLNLFARKKQISVSSVSFY